MFVIRRKHFVDNHVWIDCKAFCVVSMIGKKGHCIILICSIVIFRSIYIQRSYYPMGGEVTILAKQADNYGYYITVEQGKPDDAGWGQFELKCTQEQYEAVDVGDVVKCDREQSIVTNSGTVHKIQKR